MFRAADALDVDGYVGYLAPGVRFRFGNADPLTGREAVRMQWPSSSRPSSGLKHTILREWRADDMIIQNSTSPTPAMTATRHAFPRSTSSGSAMASLPITEIYVDLAPVYA